MRWWIKLVLGLAAVALMAVFVLRIGSLTLNVLRANGGDTGEHDPMFAEEPEPMPTMPSEPEDEKTFGDNSSNWDVSVQTPVDRTAEELGEEARAASATEAPEE